MKVYWFYYRSLVLINAGLSLVLSLIKITLFPVPDVSLDIDQFTMEKFAILFSSLGFILSFMMDFLFNKRKKILLFNMGYGLVHLFVVLCGINSLLSIVLWSFHLI